MIGLHCGDVKILAPRMAIPLPCTSYRNFYDPEKVQDLDIALENAFTFHYCNKKRTGTNDFCNCRKSKRRYFLTGTDFPIEDNYTVNEKHPLYILMKRNCPIVEKNILRGWIGKSYDGPD